MGFFDKMKKKAQDAVASVQGGAAQPMPPQGEGVASASMEENPAPVPTPQATAAPTYDGPTFTYDGDTLPIPAGFEDLSLEDWYLKMETLRDKVFKADELDLPRMTDEDGDDLDPEEVVLIQEGFLNGGHYEKLRNWGMAFYAQQTGEQPADIEIRMTTWAREQMTASKAKDMGGAGGMLEPVEGVSCEQWAHINAAIAQGGNLDELIAQASMDRAKWNRVTAEWNHRMSTDATFTVTTIYGNAFAGGGAGQFSGQAAHAANVGVNGELGDEPVPFEKFCEIEAAMACGTDKGQDPQEILASFGISAADWGMLGMFWSKKIHSEGQKYHALYTQYSDHYRAQYS